MGDEARSDIALSVAALVFGPLLLGSLRGGTGVAGVLLDLAVVLALTALVPVLLVQSRARSGGRTLTAALGLDGSPQGAVAGFSLAAVAGAAGAIAMTAAGAAPDAALLGRLSGDPLQIVQVVGLGVGSFVFVTFLVRRGADAFPRSPEWTLRRLLRTIGMGAAAVALVAGLLRVPLGADPVRVIVNALALATIVLLTDRLIGTRRMVPRLALMLPAGLTLYLHLTAFGFGAGLQAGGLAAGIITVIGALTLSARGAWPAVPLIVATFLWPTCLTPLALVRGLC